jgi:hypothetical protein
MVLAYLATSVIAVPVLVMAGGVPYVDQLTVVLGLLGIGAGAYSGKSRARRLSGSEHEARVDYYLAESRRD